MNLIGGWLPFIGYRESTLPCDVATEAGIHQAKLAPGRMDEILVDAFEFEWFGFGVTLWVRPKL